MSKKNYLDNGNQKAFELLKKQAEAKKAESASDSAVKPIVSESVVKEPSDPAKPAEAIEPATNVVEQEEAPVVDAPEIVETHEPVAVEGEGDELLLSPAAIRSLDDLDRKGGDPIDVLDQAAQEIYGRPFGDLTPKQMQSPEFNKIVINHAQNSINELEQQSVEPTDDVIVEPSEDSTTELKPDDLDPEHYDLGNF